MSWEIGCLCLRCGRVRVINEAQAKCVLGCRVGLRGWCSQVLDGTMVVAIVRCLFGNAVDWLAWKSAGLLGSRVETFCKTQIRNGPEWVFITFFLWVDFHF